MSHHPLFAKKPETIEYLVEHESNENGWLTICDYIARQNYFLSIKAIANERERQLKLPYFVIHPFSLFRYYWEIWMIVLYVIAFLFIPFESCNVHFTSINKENFVNYGVPLFSLHFIFIIDMILTFRSGYVENNTKQIILDQKQIAWRYMKTYFLIDILGTLPSLVNNYPFYILSGKMLHKEGLFLNFVKLLRIRTLSEYSFKFANVYNSFGVKYKICTVLMSSIFLVHWISCIIFLLKFTYFPEESDLFNVEQFDTNKFHQYVKIIVRASDILLAYGSYTEIKNIFFVIFSILCAIVGIFYTIYLLVKMIDITRTVMDPETKYEDFMTHLEDYMVFNKIPKHTQQLITLYFNHRYQGIYYKQDLLIPSAIITNEIKHFHENRLMQKVSLLKMLDPEVLHGLLDKFTYKIHLPKDVIVKSGSNCRYIYFIDYGIAAMCTNSGKEVLHLHDGTYFGISGLLLRYSKHQSTVIAISLCEVYLLDREEFIKAIKSHEEVYNIVVELAKKRMRIIKAAEALEIELFDDYQFVRGSDISLAPV